jgi:hypothetical protein
LARRLGNLGRDIVLKNRGALERLLRLLVPLIDEVGSHDNAAAPVSAE